jgi:hypothetical protein
MEPEDGSPGTCNLVLSGYLRAHNLSPNQLVSSIADLKLENG